MKILLAIKGLENAPGGAERVLSVITSLLADRQHEIVVVSFDCKGAESFYPLPDTVRWRQLDIGAVRRKTNAPRFLRQVWRLRRVLREERPDVAVGFMHSMYCPLAVATIGYAVPLIASEHIVPEYYQGRRFEFILLILACLRAKRVTALSDAVASRYPRILASRLVAMPNPVKPAPQRTDSQRDEPGGRPRADGAHVILNVGRMEDQKDQITLVEAFGRLAADHPDWILRIVGDGILRDEIEGRVRALGLESQVELPGILDDIEAEYRAASLFAISSRYESFGLVTAEALAAGLPVVGFADCPGTNELVADGENGLLVSGDDRPRALAEGLETLMRDPARRKALGKRAPESVRVYRPEQVADRWEALLREVAAQ